MEKNPEVITHTDFNTAVTGTSVDWGSKGISLENKNTKINKQ